MLQRWGSCFSGGDVRVGGRVPEEPEPEVFSFAHPLPFWPPGEWRLATPAARLLTGSLIDPASHSGQARDSRGGGYASAEGSWSSPRPPRSRRSAPCRRGGVAAAAPPFTGRSASQRGSPSWATTASQTAARSTATSSLPERGSARPAPRLSRRRLQSRWTMRSSGNSMPVATVPISATGTAEATPTSGSPCRRRGTGRSGAS